MTFSPRKNLGAKGDVAMSNGSITCVPGKRQGKLARMAHVATMHGDGPKLTKTVFTAPALPEAKTTTVLRVNTETRNCREQTSQQLGDKPFPHVCAGGCKRAFPQTSSQSHPHRLASCRERLLPFVLSLSSKGGWFAEPLSWKNPGYTSLRRFLGQEDLG